MKKVEYLSPSGLACFEANPTEYYLRYISDKAPPRSPQNRAMAIGSAFDAFAKAFLYEKLFGKGDEKYDLRVIFEAQVEEQHRTWAWEHGAYVFDCYKQTGALNDLLLELEKGTNQRFEFEVRGAIYGKREADMQKIENVVLLGKPDVSYISATGMHVILDFKVNGYLSARAPAPMTGYIRLRQRGGTNFGQHRTAQIMMVKGMMINVSSYLENLHPDWATQLSIYAWLCGESVGGDFVVAIDQLICDASQGKLPAIKVAEHRLRVSAAFQERIFERCVNAWNIITSDWFFRDMSQEESQTRCTVLDDYAASLEGETADDQWFKQATRGI